MLDELTAAGQSGYDAKSLQPNQGTESTQDKRSGATTGLVAKRTGIYVSSQRQRTGTNPASAVMAGMTVVLVSRDDSGNVDMEDQKPKPNPPPTLRYYRTTRPRMGCLRHRSPSLRE